MNVKEKLLEGNKLFVEKEKDNPKLKELVEGQNPFAIIVCCSDSRVIPENIFSCSFGDLFVIRTAGNTIGEDEIASIEYGIEHLHINYVLVLGHTHCGAIHAAINDEHGRYVDNVLTKIKEAIHDEKDELEASKLNAIKQANFLKDSFKSFDGIIESAIYDLETNKVIF